MSHKPLGEILPAKPDVFPDASDSMIPELRESFRPVAHRLLEAFVEVAKLSEPPKGCQRLLHGFVPEGDHMARFLDRRQRWAVMAGVQVVNVEPARVRVQGEVTHYNGRKPFVQDIWKEYGFIDHRGTQRFAGISGHMPGNPQYGAEGLDVKPELAHFELGTSMEPPTDPAYIVEYVPRNKPPRGDEAIIDMAEKLAGFLENIISKN